MIRQLLRLAHFFIVVAVVPPALWLAFAFATAIGVGTVMLDTEHSVRAAAPVLLLQLFAAASGFVVPARRGYYDLLLTRGDGRLAIAVMHWAMSVAPGIASWFVLAVTERIYGGNSMTAPGTMLTLVIVSTMPWSLTVPLPRLTGAIVWLLVFALAAAALPRRSTSAANLLLPWALLGTDPDPFTVAIVGTCVVCTTVAAFAWIRQMDVPLESGQ